MTNALLIIDIQNDFLPGGALAVPGGDEVIPVANRLIELKGSRFDFVAASQDFHPAGHQSFASQHRGKRPGDVIDLNGIQQVLWPDHCVQGTLGCEIAKDLNNKKVDSVFKKGMDSCFDSYSAFFDNSAASRWNDGILAQMSGDTGLNVWLESRRVTGLTILGLATDYCVLFSVLDALKLGYHVSVVKDGCRGVDVVRGDSARAIEKMRALGAEVVTSDSLLIEHF